MGKAKAPPAPNYAALAQTQGDVNKDAAVFNTNVNRVNQVGPDGSLTWEMAPGTDPKNPGAGAYTQRTTLSPAQQGIYNSNNRIEQSYLNTGERGLGRVNDAMSQPFDTSQLGDMTTSLQGGDDASRQRVEQAMLSRMEPQFQRDEGDMRNQLANSGITVGSDAYNREMDRLGRQKNDARQQAVLAGGQEDSRQFAQQQAAGTFGNQARQQGVQEQAYLRSLPLNEVNALRTGAQTNMPSFGNYYTGGQAQAAPVFDAGLAQGNYALQASGNSQSGQNALYGGLANLGGAAIKYYSDRRLKTDVKRVGVLMPGVNIYTYTIFGRPEVGVMADELQKVRPDLVSLADDGYYQVDYSEL